MEKAGTLPNEIIHITFKYVVHFHGHHNKMVPSLSSLHLQILVMVLSFAIAPIG
jgi:hypothetical protein